MKKAFESPTFDVIRMDTFGVIRTSGPEDGRKRRSELPPDFEA